MARKTLGSWAMAAASGLTVLTGTGSARDFFVDAANGDDTRPGTSPAAAWQSLAKVNDAALQPGDTVRFKRGGVWRGSLSPTSGRDGAPVTYTSYGDGDKPLLLGSVARSSPEDWELIGPGLWATRQPTFRPIGPPTDFRHGDWHHHQEQGAEVDMTRQVGQDGDTLRLECRHSGSRSNHIQLWGVLPDGAVAGEPKILEFRFRARATKPFQAESLTVRRGQLPWTIYGSGNGVAVKRDWQDFAVRFEITTWGELPRIHLSLGGQLPAGCVFELQPRELVPLASTGPAPLSVDVGNVIFDEGQACGWKKWSIDELDAPLDYFYDRLSRRVFLRCDADPGERYRSVELALKRHVVDQGNAHHVVYDGLALKYGAAHGFGGGNTHHLVIRNCDLSYIGGAHQHSARGRPVRYGNGIEFWGAAHDNLVEGCRLWEIYDAALTNQGRGPDSKQFDIIYRNNIIWNAEYSFEYWNNPETAETRNIRFVNNTCVNAGLGWAHTQRPDPNGSHLMLYTNTAHTEGIEIKYNIFCQSTDWGSRFSAGWQPLPDIDYNLWYEPDGFLCWFFKDKLPAADVDGYRRKTGFDRHSRFADPGFVDAGARDFHLRTDSPARQIRPDGGIVGAASLWNAP